MFMVYTVSPSLVSRHVLIDHFLWPSPSSSGSGWLFHGGAWQLIATWSWLWGKVGARNIDYIIVVTHSSSSSTLNLSSVLSSSPAPSIMFHQVIGHIGVGSYVHSLGNMYSSQWEPEWCKYLTLPAILDKKSECVLSIHVTLFNVLTLLPSLERIYHDHSSWSTL